MARPSRFEHNKWLGDKGTMLVHDLDNTTDACKIDELMSAERFAAIGPDTLPEARNRCYEPCPHCAAPNEAG